MNKVIDEGFRSCRFISTIVKHPVDWRQSGCCGKLIHRFARMDGILTIRLCNLQLFSQSSDSLNPRTSENPIW